MVGAAQSRFNTSELDDLRALIRLTVEFRHYLEYGSTKMAGMLLPRLQHFGDLENANTAPFNKYDMEFVCDSIRSGIDSFWVLNAGYRILVGSTGSNIKWGIASSWDLFRKQFLSMFDQFAAESNFENKCRLLLDLFKLQIVFLGFSHK